jgi:glycosidase
MLLAPSIAVPHSLSGQLEYIREKWGLLLGKYLFQLLRSLDLIREEEKAIFLGTGPARVYEFGDQVFEPERFSQDRDWMPSVVIIAKNAYVWMDQLSKKYEQHIHRLDQIPDEELDTLREWGFTGLWLIGLWERSTASREIKHRMGNPDAVASAYSLLDYQIATALGGDEAYQNLAGRAWNRGIRLASDMVPNHMGIDSRWVVEHPTWFLSLNQSPFPSYSFDGPNLSWDDRVGIYLEDHYYDRSDAAVVFKRVDHHTGSEIFIYHGNDGTSMPWNDTAQLNFLHAEAREAVIQTILHVARKFPIIRFDAAMTLAKKHFQRLWYPEPGTGGAIPTRSEYGLTKADFDNAMPIEFWREVVDRVAQEVPDTLLLAEAFWLMEGYFVRTLGMHRVYNSAFMNMLRDEENANYRSVMKNTLEFDPEILKRFVNFMNNPDERTAVDQFGKGDKYFGICLLMATLPGLPMFGHGQIEGFTEKYGMEYQRSYWDEQPDSTLVDRHRREIFPLLHRRYLFAEVSNYLLYDFFTPEGYVNEDVYAYSNRSEEERSLVIYHNKFAETRGWIRNSVGFAVKDGPEGQKSLVQNSLGEGLSLHDEAGYFAIFRDQLSGLQYIRNSQEIRDKGLFFELGAYKAHVFLDFREVKDDVWHQYAHLTAYLNGRGVPDIEEARREILLRPIHEPMRSLINPGMFQWLIDNRVRKADDTILPQVQEEVLEKTTRLFTNISEFLQQDVDEQALAERLTAELEILLSLSILAERYPRPRSRKYKAALKYLKDGFGEGDTQWPTLLGWLFVHSLGQVTSPKAVPTQSRSWIDEWLLGKIIAQTISDIGIDENTAWYAVSLIKVITTHQHWHLKLDPKRRRAHALLERLLRDTEAQGYLQVNRYQGVLWFNKETFETLLWWLYVVAIINTASNPGTTAEEISEEVMTCFEIVQKVLKAAEDSGYRLDETLTELRN